MAKKRRLKPSGDRTVVAQSPPPALRAERPNPSMLAAGGLGGSLVYLAYHPSDAAVVDSGGALWFAMLSLVICLLTFWPQRSGDRGQAATGQSKRADRLDGAVWALAAWIMLAAFLNAGVGNLRMGTNEAWLWISGAAVFSSVRRIGAGTQTACALGILVVVCAVGLAIHAMHQQWVTLPMDRIAFQEDPDRVLAAAGYEAPQYSAERAVFAGRLMDGGPTATFALANSLAAILLAGCLIAIGVVRFRFQKLSFVQLVAWVVAGLLCAVALWMTQSRSAMIAGACGLIVMGSGGHDSLYTTLTKRRYWLAAISTISTIGVISWILVGSLRMIDHPAIHSAYQSLAFRFQYWRSTWRMIGDRPWVGAGPGNFQAMYDRYREPTTSEQIADPHNLIFETLGSGGVIGLILLVVCIVLAVRAVVASRSAERGAAERGAAERGAAERGATDRVETASFDIAGARWVWIGAAVSLGLVWVLGFAVRQLPDFQASLFALPVACGCAGLLGSSARAVSGSPFGRILWIAGGSVAFHLLFSGGWTVPGVAIVIWFTAGISVPVPDRNREPGVRGGSYAIAGLCIVGMCVLYLMSLRPVQSAANLVTKATYEIEDGRYGLAEQLLEQASQADRWATEPIMGLADLLHWKLIREDTPGVRRQWEAALKLAKQRAGQDPSVYRAIGSQQVHLYQRHGRTDDLAAAAETFETAFQWSPVNQWMAAQLASVVAERGATTRAKELTTEAKRLSSLGINTERIFQFQMIYPAHHFGESAGREAIRKSAADVLSEPG